jgi:hypothetical protein
MAKNVHFGIVGKSAPPMIEVFKQRSFSDKLDAMIGAKLDKLDAMIVEKLGAAIDRAVDQRVAQALALRKQFPAGAKGDKQFSLYKANRNLITTVGRRGSSST